MTIKKRSDCKLFLVARGKLKLAVMDTFDSFFHKSEVHQTLMKAIQIKRYVYSGFKQTINHAKYNFAVTYN